MDRTVLELRHIRFGFNGCKSLLDDVTLTLDKGKICTLMGGNGSGKTTLLNIISGFLKPKAGSEIILYPLRSGTGEKIRLTELQPYNISRAGVGRTFQDLRIISRASVNENVLLAMKGNPGDNWLNALLPSLLYRKAGKRLQMRADDILSRCNLAGLRNRLAGELSYGQQKLLTLACCMAGDAELMLLDEPVAGISPVIKEHIASLLIELKKEHRTILLIEHNTDFIQEVTDHYIFLNNGVLSNYNSFQDMRSNPKVRGSYM